MPRRKRAPAAPGEHPAAQLRGHDARGSVRPADNRYLDEDEIAMRDSYLEEVNPSAQQLVIKAESPEHVASLSSRETRPADTTKN